VDLAGTSAETQGIQDHVVVRDKDLQTKVKGLHPGDLISLTYSADKDGQRVTKLFSIDATTTTTQARVVVILGSGLICFLLYYLLSGLHPLRLIIGEDGRYSNSKFQIALWFAVLITTYLATVLLRRWYAGPSFFGGVNIPQNLLLISGMSAFTFAAAKGITSSKVNEAAAKGVADPKNSANVKASFLKDLTHNDKPQLDLGDFQMIVVTILAVAMYFGMVIIFLGSIEKAHTVTLPDVDTTILAAFGLGQGAYLTKKAVANVGE
jgi:hypothetical protein